MTSGNITHIDAHRAPAIPPHAAPPPMNVEAEQAVLGAMLMNNEVIGHITSFLEPGHFCEDIHRRIFDVALMLHKDGKPVSPVTLKTYLADDDLGNGVTTWRYLFRLAAEAMPPLVAPDYAREIRDLAVRRDLIAVGDELSALARDAKPSANAVELASNTLTALQRIAETAVAADTRREAGKSATTVIENARAVLRGEKRDTGVSTGLRDLDRATAGGFRQGTLWIVAGRPRMGKSVLGTGFARKVASRGARLLAEGEQGVGAHFFSLELAEDEIIARMLSDLAFSPRRPISFGNILSGHIEEDDLWALEEAQKTLDRLPLVLDVAPSLTVQEIAARVRSEKARMAKKNVRLAVVVIDYMKFIRATDRYRGNRVYEVGETTGALKQLAKSEGVCVVLLAQVNRAVDKSDRKDKAPNLSDLRDSGDIEADADVVLFIDRESVRLKQSAEYKANDPETVNRYLDLKNKADLIIAKTRTGGESTVTVWFDAGSSKFASEAQGGA